MDSYVIAPRRVALFLGLVALAATTTLIIVANVEDADALATIALALAILAFAAQLADTAISTQSSSQQLLHAERIQTDTASMLTEIRGHAAAMATTVDGHMTRLITHVLEAVPSAVEESKPPQGEAIDMEQLRQTLEANLRDLIEQERRATSLRFLDSGNISLLRSDRTLERIRDHGTGRVVRPGTARVGQDVRAGALGRGVIVGTEENTTVGDPDMGGGYLALDVTNGDRVRVKVDKAGNILGWEAQDSP